MNGHSALSELQNVQRDVFLQPDRAQLLRPPSTHRPRILLLYGSLRTRSYSRLLTQEAARILESFGAETRVFDPEGLPLPDSVPADHPKVAELRSLSQWSEGHVSRRRFRSSMTMDA